MSKKDDRERLHLLVPSRTKKLLDDLQQRTGAGTMTEVIRSALAVYDALIREMEDGKEIVIHDPKERNAAKAERRVLLVA